MVGKKSGTIQVVVFSSLLAYCLLTCATSSLPGAEGADPLLIFRKFFIQLILNY